jgi:hypothetical protein
MLGGDFSSATSKELTSGVLGLTMMGLGAPKPSGTLGTFGGAKAKYAPLKDLAEAKKMAIGSDLGYIKPDGSPLPGPPENPKDIWDKTGWYKGPDDKWRFEIDDSHAELTPNVKINSFTDPAAPKVAFPKFFPQKLSKVLDHPSLYENYPELANTPVKGLPFTAVANNIKGAVFANGAIGIGHVSPDEAKSILLHEIQHKIQSTEGFAHGGNPEEFLPDGFDATYQQILDNITKTKDLLRKNGINTFAAAYPTSKQPYILEHVQKAKNLLGPDKYEDYINNFTQLNLMNSAKKEAFASYQNLAGEVEARNVQERAALGDQGPGSSFPPEGPAQAGFPENKQIIRYLTTDKNNKVQTLVPVDHNPFGDH